VRAGGSHVITAGIKGTPKRNASCAAPRLKGSIPAAADRDPSGNMIKWLPSMKAFAAKFDYARALVIRSVPRCPHRTSKEQVIAQCVFDHAVEITNQAAKENNVDEGGVVRNDDARLCILQ
jgi:hypothetical protein